MPCSWTSSHPTGKHHVLALHSTQSHVGRDMYVQWWADMWCQVTHVVDPMSVLADTNSAAWPEECSRPQGDDVRARVFL